MSKYHEAWTCKCGNINFRSEDTHCQSCNLEKPNFWINTTGDSVALTEGICVDSPKMVEFHHGPLCVVCNKSTNKIYPHLCTSCEEKGKIWAAQQARKQNLEQDIEKTNARLDD